ncbi:RraA family protein [Glycomyces terrestris]|uniref:RraA family protein n=1 Tax=Glycomyces terrestris TaxID=2493553 RepID=A0A426V387_9ACTN|nr:RraA family protein [Glycomyces terrestris]RRS01327.1 RraA family protein [Glycomyces terrestris]
MEALELRRAYRDLTTAHVADALIRLGLPVRSAPAGVLPLWEGAHLVGRALPARHYGSVDVFLEAIDRAEPGDVLVVDNAAREDESCVGDLAAHEAAAAGLAGIAIWGYHRDTADLRRIRLPVFSRGALPAGPQRLDEREPDALAWAAFGPHRITAADFVVGDDDGLVFAPLDHAAAIADAAAVIRDVERRQADRLRQGATLREQVRFAEYLAARDRDGTTFRQHLRAIGGAIEE